MIAEASLGWKGRTQDAPRQCLVGGPRLGVATENA